MATRNDRYTFGAFTVDPQRRLLLKSGQPIAVSGKAFDILLFLVRNPGRVVDKNELMEHVWPGQAVEDANLTVSISALRKALGDRPGDPAYVVTVAGRGYQWIADVNAGGAPPDAAPHESARMNAGTFEGVPIAPRRRYSGYLRAVAIVLAVVVVAFVGSRFVLWRRAARHEPVRSLAVLPFRPLVAGVRNESLELGLADILVTRLGNLNQLIVRPTSAIRRYGSPDQDPLAAGRELGVDAVVEGTIHRTGDEIKVTARLIRVADGSSLWAGEFDERFTSVLQVEDAISENVARALRIQLTGTELSRLTRHGTEDSDAYWEYVAGRYEWNKLTPEGWTKSVDHFERAIEHDPHFALAFSGLADAYVSLGADSRPAADVMGKAKEAAARALDLDEGLSEAHVSLAGVLAYYEWNWDAAGREFRRGIALKPNSADAHREYGLYLATVGSIKEALAETARAQDIEPFSRVTSFAVGWALTGARDYDGVIAHFRRALEIDPHFIAAHNFIGLGYIGKRMYEPAASEFREALGLSQERLLIHAQLGFAEGAAGRPEAARKILEDLTAASKQRYVSPYYFALVHAGLGETDAAFAYLEGAYHDRSRRLWALRLVPTWDNLRSDPRFGELLHRIGLDNAHAAG